MHNTILLSGTFIVTIIYAINVKCPVKSQVREGMGGWDALEPSAMRALHIYAND